MDPGPPTQVRGEGKREEKRKGGRRTKGENEPKSSIFRRGKGKPAAGEKFLGYLGREA